jgi:hypothetical protein
LSLMDESNMFASRKAISLTGGISYIYLGVVA